MSLSNKSVMRLYIKNLLLSILAVVGTTHFLQAQQEATQTRTIRSGIIVKSTPLPFLFETIISGNIAVKQEALLFTSSPCSDVDKKVSSFFPCNNYLISEVNLKFDDVSKIRRRNFLFLFPNRLVVHKTNGENYLFTTYRRKFIIEAYNNYRAKKTSIGMK